MKTGKKIYYVIIYIIMIKIKNIIIKTNKIPP